ncbi:MAG: DUF1501 domain-containing protein [Verrucomicrobiota bacterium]|nr:DUF1501 domain-containing protein [Verrucomicrobiota bacterium]MDG1891564.1 DUF1501 domain-containing protein [Verrucomicrobiota bacterium]
MNIHTRRHFFGNMGLGFGTMALQSLLNREVHGAAETGFRLPAKAKSVIYLHMAGSPSQIDLFEHKPALHKFHGADCPKEYLEGKRFAFIKGTPKMLEPQFDIQQHGQTGQWVSTLLPAFSKVVDDVCIIRSCHTEQFNHSPAQLLLQTGNSLPGYPSMGSWITYGIGSLSKDLPGFVVLASGGKTPSAGKSLWGSGFLPTLYQGVQCRTDGGDPILYLSDPPGMSRPARRHTLDALKDLNHMQHVRTGDPETITRIAQYELAFRMQMSVPEVMDISREPAHILRLYGAKPGHISEAETASDPRTLYKGNDPTFANNCVLARRLVENGVRFVQLYDWGWDHHGSSPGESIDETLPIKSRQIDQAIAALITDLKQRGMLEETLIVWGGEFGRTPMMQNNARSDLKKGFIGRDHHPYAFTMWMAGGGIQPGAYGHTDEIGYYVAENPVGMRDLQATILHQVGIHPHRFGYPYQGLNNRLIGPTDEGKVIRDILV